MLEKGKYPTRGDNLLPFFAGLLPEGRRLTALISLVKTSADDLFSLLLASGTDCIGDVFASLQPIPTKEEDSVTRLDLSEVVFADVFEKSILTTDYAERKRDLTIPGVQPKVSAERFSIPVSLASKNKSYILKLAPEKFPKLVENEHFFMQLAAKCGLQTAKTQIVYDQSASPGLLVERFDRIWQGSEFQRLHQEDACQFLSRYPQDKYRLSLRQIAEGIARYASSSIIESARLLEIAAFSYIIANGDLHAKNISMLAEMDAGRIVLSPAYDLVSTLPYGDQSMALELEGKKNNLRPKDFIAWGNRCGVREAATKSILKRLSEGIRPQIDQIGQIGFDERKTDFLCRTIEQRLEALSRF